jgi:hypothetical protein
LDIVFMHLFNKIFELKFNLIGLYKKRGVSPCAREG